MNLILERYAYTPNETEGKLIVGDVSFFTLERPWIAHSHAGGKPFESCIPDGEYQLIPYIRNRVPFDHVLCYVNEDLGVYYTKASRPGDDGRYKCLQHPANFTRQVVGCTALGDDRVIYKGKPMVTKSRDTFDQYRELIDFNEIHTIEIRRHPGAVGTI